MAVKLTPVIELFFSNSDAVAFPKKSPYWEHADDYQKYNEQCLAHWGYDTMLSAGKGSMFFPVTDFSFNNTDKLVKRHFAELELAQYNDDELSAIAGGYVLSINDKPLLYPQCCCSLSDISCWMDLANGNPDALMQMSSHPAPKTSFEGDNIIIDLAKTNSGERFSPTPANLQITIKKQELQSTLNEVYKILDKFADQIKRLNQAYGLDQASDLLWRKLIFDEE